MRVKPSLLTGILVLLGYLAVVFTVWIIAGVDYDEVGDTVDNVRNVIAMSMIVGAVYVAVVTSVLGWWKPSLREPRRADHHKWMWIIPIVLALGVVANLATTKWGESRPARHLRHVAHHRLHRRGLQRGDDHPGHAHRGRPRHPPRGLGVVRELALLRPAPRAQRLLRPEREGHGAAGVLRLRRRHRLLRHPAHHAGPSSSPWSCTAPGTSRSSSRATRSTSSTTSRWRSAAS